MTIKNDRVTRAQNYEARKYFPVATMRGDNVRTNFKLWSPDVLSVICTNMATTDSSSGFRRVCVVLSRKRMFHVVRWKNVAKAANDGFCDWVIEQTFTKRQKEAAIMAMVLMATQHGS